MKRNIGIRSGIGLILLLSMIMSGCVQEEIVEEEKSIYLGTLYGFFMNLERFPEATTGHTIEDVTKIIYTSGEYGKYVYSFAIDIGAQEMYTTARLPVPYYDGADYAMTEEEINEILTIIELYNILTWDSSYGTEYAELDESVLRRYGWTGWDLLIQFSDGTMLTSTGQTNAYYENLPKGRFAFVESLREFVESKEPNLMKEEIVLFEWYTGMSSYILNGTAGDQIKITLQEDTEHEYTLVVRDNLPYFEVRLGEEVYASGFLRPYDTSVTYLQEEEAPLNSATVFLERSVEEYPQYILGKGDRLSTEEYWYYEIRLDEINSGVYMSSYISEEIIREIYELLSFEVVTESSTN
ncbi:MAG: hypothetical protein R3Y67_02440 [Eubacteriales bacterium]